MTETEKRKSLDIQRFRAEQELIHALSMAVFRVLGPLFLIYLIFVRVHLW